MNKELRKKMVLAMELIARSVSNEEEFEDWMIYGVGDGDIDYGSFNIDDVDDYYIRDDNFKDLMSLFLILMKCAFRDGGLYCDNIVSKDRNDYKVR